MVRVSFDPWLSGRALEIRACFAIEPGIAWPGLPDGASVAPPGKPAFDPRPLIPCDRGSQSPPLLLPQSSHIIAWPAALITTENVLVFQSDFWRIHDSRGTLVRSGTVGAFETVAPDVVERAVEQCVLPVLTRAGILPRLLAQ